MRTAEFCATGWSVIVDGLSQQFARDQMVIIGRICVRWPHMSGRRIGPEIQYFGNDLSWPRRGQRYVRWIRWFTLPTLVSKITRLARQRNARAILAIFPNEYFLLASYLAARRLKCRSTRFCTTRISRTAPAGRCGLAKWLEPRIFRTSPVVFVANDGMLGATTRDPPRSALQSLVRQPSERADPRDETPPVPGTPVKLAFQGNLNESNIDAARRLAEIVNRRERLRAHDLLGHARLVFRQGRRVRSATSSTRGSRRTKWSRRYVPRISCYCRMG